MKIFLLLVAGIGFLLYSCRDLTYEEASKKADKLNPYVYDVVYGRGWDAGWDVGFDRGQSSICSELPRNLYNAYC